MAEAEAAPPLRRVLFLTDMQSHFGDEAGVLAEAQRQAGKGAHTSVIGVGVDLSVGTVEKLSATPGGKYELANDVLSRRAVSASAVEGGEAAEGIEPGNLGGCTSTGA